MIEPVSPRWTGCLALALALLTNGCGATPATACHGFADRKLGVTAAEYRPCAGEILAALDSLEPPLRVLVSDAAKSTERDVAKQTYRQLRALIRETGIEADYRSMRPGTVLTKWPDRDVSAFNSAAFNATVQYMAVLSYPNRDNFAQGVRAHDIARRYYARIR